MSIKFKDLPGPKGIPFFGSLFDMDYPNIHNQFQELAEEHGEVYRLKMGMLNLAIVGNPKIIQYILRERPDRFIRMKKLDKVFRAEGVHGAFNAEGDDWRMHRRLVAKGLNIKHQEAFFDQMLISVDRLYNKWKEVADSGREFNIQDDFMRFTTDITTSLAFGIEMNTIEEKGGTVQEHMDKIFPMIFKRINDPIQWHKVYKNKKDREFDKSLKVINEMIDKWIVEGRKRLAQNPALRENPTNFLEAILVESDNEESFKDEEVKGNLMTVLIAGEDTTAHTMTWMIYLLTKYTDYQSKLQDEVDELLGDQKRIHKFNSTSDYKFLESVAYETMRLKPVAPIMLFEPLEDFETEGYEFKKGSRILMHWRHAATKETNFTEGKKFYPERWMNTTKCPVHNSEAYIPFGGGPRFCPGKNLAILEMKLVLSMLFKNFDVEMVTPHKDIREIMAFVMKSSDFKVRLKNRS